MSERTFDMKILILIIENYQDDISELICWNVIFLLSYL